MPLYRCFYEEGALDEAVMPAIASALTDVHCEETGAPPEFVHVFFKQADVSAYGVKCLLTGSIRAGRTEDVKERIISRMQAAVSEHGGVSADKVTMRTVDIPASWVMEGGDILPEPGEEEAWLDAHHAKLSEA